MNIEHHLIENPHPLEVNIKRLPLSYEISYNQLNKNTKPVFVIHGYGMYVEDEYMKSIGETLCKDNNVAIITLNYVGTFMKRSNIIKNKYPYVNEKNEFLSQESEEYLIKVIDSIKEAPEHYTKYLKEMGYLEDVADMRCAIKALTLLKQKILQKRVDALHVQERLFELNFKKSLIPLRHSVEGDHQDFGFIQAIDILTVFADIKNSETFENISWHLASIVGSSHGGYLASMCNKLAPNTFSSVVDSCGWLEPTNDVSDIAFTSGFGGMGFASYEENYWSDDEKHENFFSKNNFEIRKLDKIEHLRAFKKQQIKANNYFCIHTSNDTLIPIASKDSFIQLCHNNNIPVDYLRLQNSSQLSKTFKSLDHGAKASLKGLVYDYILNNNKTATAIEKNDFELKSEINYTCSEGIYTISFKEKYPKVTWTPSS